MRVISVITDTDNDDKKFLEKFLHGFWIPFYLHFLQMYFLEFFFCILVVISKLDFDLIIV